MPRAKQPTAPADLVAGLTQLSKVVGTLRNIKAAGKVIVPVIAQALALMPDQRLETTNGNIYGVDHAHGPSDVRFSQGEGVGTRLILSGQDADWAMFGEDLPEIVEKLLENPHVQALDDPRLEQLAGVVESWPQITQ